MLVTTFIEQLPDFFNQQADRKAMWATVKKQMINHTRRVKEIDLIRNKRPGEEDAINEYRNNNHHRLTKAAINEMLSKTARIARQSGINTDRQSDELEDYLARKPFWYLNKRVDIWEWWENTITILGVEDPNAVILSFPYNKANPTIPPVEDEKDGGLPKSEKVNIRNMIIPSERIAFMPTEEYPIFSWKPKGQVQVKGAKEGVLGDYYYLVDEESYYVLLPVKKSKGRGKKTSTEYELDLWYPHLCGMEYKVNKKDYFDKMLPISTMPGVLTTSECGGFSYNESILHGAIEYFDAFIKRFSDADMIATRYGYPIRVVNDDVACKQCNGTGQVRTIHNGEAKMGVCGSCSNVGIANDLGPSTEIRRKNRGLEKGSSRPLIEYPTPPVQIQELSFDQAFKMFDKGQRKMGIAMLEDSGRGESGITKNYRMQPSEDFLNTYTHGFFKELMGSFIFHLECLLQRNIKQRKQPIIKLPTSYKVKDYDYLNDQAGKTFHFMRMFLQLNAIEQMHGDEVMSKVVHWAYCYCPIITNTEEEIQYKLENGVYTREDVVKRDWMPIIVKEYLKNRKGDQLDEDNFQAFAKEFLDDKIVRPAAIVEVETVEVN